MTKIIRLGFLINPIAGLGGRVGLKGSDGVVAEARMLGAEPIAQNRAHLMLRHFKDIIDHDSTGNEIQWITAGQESGQNALERAGFTVSGTVHTPAVESSASDTRTTVEKFLELSIDLIVFCGGDGTARDICSIVADKLPVLGVPSGVKMYSGVFANTPRHAALILHQFVNGELDLVPVEVLDLDEQAYRQDKWVVRMYYTALTPYARSLTQHSKAIVESHDDASIRAELANMIARHMSCHTQSLYLMGPGSTVQAICQQLGLEKTLLGVDAVCASRVVANNVNERDILQLCERYESCYIVVSPIGAQGFVLGRGNLQLSPKVLQQIDLNNLLVVATPAKLATIDRLQFDTGDAHLDSKLSARRFMEVIVSDGRYRMVPCHQAI